MNNLDILRQRLYNQRLTGPQIDEPEEVVKWLGAVQSQDYAGAKWSVGQRVKHSADAGVEQAFASGKILRTHVMRPTWHFVTPADIRWILELTAPRVQALNAYYYRKLELDKAVFARSHTLFTQALQGGKQLTRQELASLLRQAGIVASNQRLAYIVMHAELNGLICSGAMRGKQYTYTLLEERAPAARHLERDEALAELTQRFFASHGPVTLKDYIWWSGLSVADAKAGHEMIKQRLRHEVVGDQTYWFSLSMPTAEHAPMAAYLLPEYDEYLRGAPLPDMPWTKNRDSWKDTFYRPVIIDNMRAGTWRRTITRGAVVMEINLSTSLNPAQSEALKAAVERYGLFMDMPVIFNLPQ